MEQIKRLGKDDYEDFLTVFRVWEGYPFYEAWTDEQYQEEFMDFINTGVIYAYYDEGVICGLTTIKPQYKKWDQLDIDVENCLYMSDIAVVPGKRNKGYATRLLDVVLEEYQDKFDIYFRTNETGSMSEGIARKRGFELMNAPIQEVEFKRTREDLPTKDKRKYLMRKKSK